MRHLITSARASIVLLIIVLLLAQGCASPERLPAVPEDLQTQAQVIALPGVRYRLGRDDAELVRDAIESYRREQAYLASIGHQGPLPRMHFLAISGGGDDGAFGAGLLNGWTAAGDRPEFGLVTGVSTGALTAPFAFLGSDYDDRLRAFYTNISAADILEKRSLLAALTSDALADNRPLWQLVAKEVDRDLLDAIAVEYKKGRLLLIGTADLDARQPVIWNMTKIAANPGPEALELFRAIMVASAAIPAAFPPMMIDVEVDGRRYQEMHVDGGTMAQVFVYPTSLDLKGLSSQLDIKRERKLYVIRNARLDPDWASVDRRTLSIAGRAIASLIHTQGIGDLFRIYLTAQRDGVEFNLAFIPATFNAPRKEDFDPEYMGALFDAAYDMAAKGYPWDKVPPGFTPVEVSVE